MSTIVTASFGVASEICIHDGTGEKLMQAADASMYRAKAAGRNRIVAIDAETIGLGHMIAVR